jgi:formylglycine-generating enzyme required for sulfatase activity
MLALRRKTLLLAVVVLAWQGCSDDSGGGDGGGGDGGADTMKPDMDTTIPSTWVTIKPGSFKMGSPSSDKCRVTFEISQRTVTVSHSFKIMSTEVTKKQYKAVMGYLDTSFPSCGEDCPVDKANWYEGAAYCNALSRRAGFTECYTCTGSKADVKCEEVSSYKGSSIINCPGYHLPSEIEWEYAYRAGTATDYYSGAADQTLCEKCDKVDANADSIGWYCFNSGSKPHPVGKKKPNAWGLYDMAGNVTEWVNDSASANIRIVKGGNFADLPQALRGAFRSHTHPEYHGVANGFRCALKL